MSERSQARLDALVARWSDTGDAVAALLERVRYKDSWRFVVERGHLAVYVVVQESVGGGTCTIKHNFLIPPELSRAERSLRMWLFEQIMMVELHEAMEFFLVDGAAPYFPSHQGGAYDGAYDLREREKPFVVARTVASSTA